MQTHQKVIEIMEDYSNKEIIEEINLFSRALKSRDNWLQLSETLRESLFESEKDFEVWEDR